MGGVTLPFSRWAEWAEGLRLCLLGHGRLLQPSCVRLAPALGVGPVAVSGLTSLLSETLNLVSFQAMRVSGGGQGLLIAPGAPARLHGA